MENIDVGGGLVCRSGWNCRKGDDVDADTPEVKTPAIVLVEWLDAEHEFGWMDGNEIEDSEPVLNCFTIGWLLKKTKTHIRVCQTFSHNNHAQTLVIPKGMIIAMTVLQPPITRCARAKKSK